VLTVQGLTAAAAGTGLAIAGRMELLGWDQGAERLGMAGLSAALALRRRSRWLSLQADRVRRRRLGGVGGIELEPGLKIADAGFQGGDLSREGIPSGQEGSLSLRRHGVPERFGDRRLVAHTNNTDGLYKRFGV